ncbi:NAD(P)-dependent oxidoreductase [Geminicoccus roseus]|uniref:NAD(P)-dependent oxidoreductase n=1 Tax=Geminicoccus roseus TaxID=404900 RepID=UPI0003FF764B|nr:NAD(P)-dependent oxidoreductase [Geminicoccus roseus]
MHYAFIGLGHLGGHLAMNLVKGGFAVTVHDLDRDAAAGLVQAGARFAASAALAVAEADALITCLPSPKASTAVLEAVLPHLRPGTTWIEMSTVDFPVLADLARRAEEAGVVTLACPVTGGVHKAKSGEITILVGGAKGTYERHAPALKAMGGAVIHLGGLEQAATVKVMTNMLAFIHLIAAGEALMVCKQAGVDLKDAFEAIRASSGNSFVHETESQVILNGSYDIGFTMDLAVKDAGFALEIGRRLGVPLKLASMMEQTFLEGRARYGGNAWSSMIVKLLEDTTGSALRAPGFPARLGEAD